MYTKHTCAVSGDLFILNRCILLSEAAAILELSSTRLEQAGERSHRYTGFSTESEAGM